MSEPRFYCTSLAADQLSLTGPEARHALRTLRLGPGDRVVLFDGTGTEVVAQISSTPSRHEMVLAVQRRRSLPRPPVSCLTVAVGVCKGPRQRWLVEKLTELGIGGFLPMRCERSTVLPGRSTAAKWRRFAIAAAKQSRQAWLPQVAEPQDFANVIAATSAFDSAFLASAQVSAQPILTVLSQLDRPPQRLLVVVGPEGGLTDAEQSAALAAGFKPVRVGPTTLRVETAAIALAATVAAWADGAAGADL